MTQAPLDLNADLGESKGDYLNLLELITTANVACGSHAGGGELLTQTVRACIEAKVQVGAHPSYPDPENFGRTSMRGEIATSSLIKLISEQIALVQEELAKHNQALSHVKAHGALYNDAMVHEDIAEAFLEAVKRVAPNTPILGLPNSTLENSARNQDIIFIAEGYMDRAYTDQGTLVPRTLPKSVLDHEAALQQVIQIAKTRTVTTITGNTLKLPIRTICVHADTSHAAKTLAAAREQLNQQEIPVTAFVNDFK